MAIIQDVYQLETQQFQAGIAQVQKGYQGTTDSATKAGKAGEKAGKETAEGAKKATTEINKTTKATGGFENALKKVSIAVAGAFAVSKVIEFAKESVKAADVQLQAEAKLRTALQGREDMFARLTVKASELQKVTTIGDEAIIAQQAFLAAQGRTEEQINSTIEAAIQFAAVTGTDIGSAVMQLDKTLEGSAGRLSQYDSRFKDLTAEQLRNGAAIDLVNEKYKGFAEEQARTGLGAVKQLQNSFGDLQEEIGFKLLPIIAKVSNFFNDLIVKIIESNAITRLFKMGMEAIQPVIDSVRSIIDSFQRIFRSFNSEGESSIDWLKVLKVAVELNLFVLKSALVVADNVAKGIAFMSEKIAEFIEFLRSASAPIDRFFSGIQKVGRWIGKQFASDVQLGVDQLGKLRTALEGLTDAEKIARLKKWREALKDNEQAVAIIDREITKLNANLYQLSEEERKRQEEEAKRRKEALAKKLEAEREYQKQREQIARQIEDLEIQLIADDLEREDKAREVKFSRLIEDLERDANTTADEKDRLRDLLLQKQAQEDEAIAKQREDARQRQQDKETAELLKAEEERAKMRMDLFQQHFAPTLDAMYEREMAELQKALDEQLIAYEEFELLKAQIQGKYTEIRTKAEEQAASEMLANMNKSVGLASQGISDILNAIGDEQSEFAAFTKALAIFDIAMNQGQAIAAAIAGATAAAAATGPGAPFVLAGYIASMIGTVVAGFAQVSSILSEEPPRFFEGTASVERGGNPKGRDTIPALLNEGEAVIPTDANKSYPGLADSWINGNLDRFIHKNWVAPQLKAAERERAEKELNYIASIMQQGFDDYRLHKDNREMIGVMRSGFSSLSGNRSRSYLWGSK